MVATNLIELTLADGSKVQVSVLQIVRVSPSGTGSGVWMSDGRSLQVTESPSAIKTAANA